MIVAKGLLVQVSDQMERINTYASTMRAAFGQPPNTLRRVCADASERIRPYV